LRCGPPDLTTADLSAVVVMALAVVAKTGRNPDASRRCLALLTDGSRPTGQPLPAAGPSCR
jgi:hypothetical protein